MCHVKDFSDSKGDCIFCDFPSFTLSFCDEHTSYVVDFELDEDAAYQKIGYLRNISWLDAGSRFVTVDFNTFNPSTNLHTLVRLFVEMPAGGTLYMNSIIFYPISHSLLP